MTRPPTAAGAEGESGSGPGPAPDPDRSEDPASRLEERHASWLELFFDLLFVAVVAQLAHGLLGHVTAARVATVLLLFLPSWWTWVSFTYFSNTAVDDGPARRVAVLTNMACLVVMGGGVTQALHGHPALFAIGYALSRVVRTVAWLIAARDAKGHMPPFATYGLYFVSAALWAASALLHAPACYLLWAAGLAAEIATLVVTAGRFLPDINVEHIAERFGLFVIIALGEGIAQVVGALGASQSPTPRAVLTAVAGFALAAAIWWLYFDFGNEAGLAVIRARPEAAYRLAVQGFTLGHFFLVAGILAIDAGLGSAVSDEAASGSHGIPPTDIRLVAAGLLLYLTNNAVLSVAKIGFPVGHVASWWIPNALVIGAVWTAAGRLAPGVAFAILAATMIVVSYVSVRNGARQQAAA